MRAPSTRSAAASPSLKSAPRLLNAPKPLNERACSRKSAKSGYETPPRFDETNAISWEFGNGIPLNSTEFMIVKIAVLTPMPSAIVTTTTAVNARFFSSTRSAKRRSWSIAAIDTYDGEAVAELTDAAEDYPERLALALELVAGVLALLAGRVVAHVPEVRVVVELRLALERDLARVAMPHRRSHPADQRHELGVV